MIKLLSSSSSSSWGKAIHMCLCVHTLDTHTHTHTHTRYVFVLPRPRPWPGGGFYDSFVKSFSFWKRHSCRRLPKKTLPERKAVETRKRVQPTVTRTPTSSRCLCYRLGIGKTCRVSNGCIAHLEMSLSGIKYPCTVISDIYLEKMVIDDMYQAMPVGCLHRAMAG